MTIAQVEWEGKGCVNLGLDLADLVVRGTSNSQNQMGTLIIKICSFPLRYFWKLIVFKVSEAMNLTKEKMTEWLFQKKDNFQEYIRSLSWFDHNPTSRRNLPLFRKTFWSLIWMSEAEMTRVRLRSVFGPLNSSLTSGKSFSLPKCHVFHL